ncbi:MAG: TonB-dependent receptor [Gammaproteobacteria bacterium]
MSAYRNSAVTVAVASALFATRAFALDAPVPDPLDAAAGELPQEVIVTGTRQRDVKAIDSPAPVQVIASEELARTSSTPDLIQTIASLVPSLDTTRFGGDLSNLTLQASLRSLSPNDTLILVNGKRRHTTSNIGIAANGEFAGGAGVDLNFIPANAIDHIEVLTDGAAAQYGSDAIAGVINIILKKGYDGGNLQASYGAYQDGGGDTNDVTGNVGFEPYDGAHLNFTAEYRDHAHSVRSNPLDYVLNPSAPAGTYPSAGLKPIDTNVLNAPGWPILNRIHGDASYQIKLASFDSGFRFGENVELYSFGTYGEKSGSAIQNYRLPHIAAYTNPSTGQTLYQYPYGFSPLIETEEKDYGLTAGLRGALATWNWDLSTTYGRDTNDFYTRATSNTVLFSQTGFSPTDFHDGSFTTKQWTNNLDLVREFDVGLAGPLNVAVGAEYRRDEYLIGEGIPASYQLGGAAAFQGFGPLDAGSHSRTNTAAYIDFAAKVIGGLRLDIAGRHEHFSDFGNKSVGKFTARYDFSPTFALRGTASNGFRAPTVAEEFYTKSSTSPTSTGVNLAPNSAAAALFGLGDLKPETSVNYSLGLVFNPAPQFTSTLDVYQIKLSDRIVNSGTLYYLVGGRVVSPLVGQAITVNGNQLNPTLTTVSVNLFTNGVDSRTRGADLVLDYLTDFDRFGRVDWSLKANYNKTTVLGVRATPPQLAAQGLTVLDPTAFSGLSDAQPNYNINLGGQWAQGPVTINLHEIVHDTTQVVQGDNGATTGSTVTYYTTRSGVIPITNIDFGYAVLKSLRLTVGAENVFNRYPGKVNSGLLAAYQKAGFPFAAGQYANGPLGINGGYYYVKGTYSF